MKNKIKIEIWSDVVCPFCYIGKRKLEQALDLFSSRDQVEIEWKSFLLDPSMQSTSNLDAVSYLANRYGRDLNWSRQAHDQVTKMAAQVGLEYRFDEVIITSSQKAHHLKQIAKMCGKSDAAVELLFKAYFTEGKNISDTAVLQEIGTEAGIDKNLLETEFENNIHANSLNKDLIEAQKLKISGVPYFLFNNKYEVSGAQDVAVFLKALEASKE